ncbi:adhesion domain-containing protein, partial [Photobacterium sanctipauli]
LSEEGRTISLKEGVTDPQGLPVTLESVRSLSSDCADPHFNKQAMTFELDKGEPDICYYEYTVQNHPDTAQYSKISQANSYVLLSETSLAGTLPPISQMGSEGNTLVIDLVKELGGQYPAGYVLESDVVVLGNGSAEASTETTISYDATTRGVTRLLYSLMSPDTADVRAGFIDVAVSGDGNNMPEADNFNGPEDLTSGTRIVIDVAKHIRDPDGDPLQLTDVYAFNADVGSVAPNDVTNTQFYFEAEKAGDYDVSYYVTDHRGGWAVGVVHISIAGPGKPWDDIILSDGEHYTAPWEKVSADAYEIPYQGTVEETIEGENYTVTLFNYDTAESLCRTRGMEMPTVELLHKLYQERGDVNNSDGWPVAKRYWSSSISTTRENMAIDLSTGHQTVVVKEVPLIATCVYPGELSLEVIVDNAYITEDINSEGNTKNVVEATVMKDDRPVASRWVYLYSSEENLHLNMNGHMTGSDGKISFDVRSDLAGTFEVTASYFTQKATALLTFIEDVIKSLVVSGPELVAIGETIQLKATAEYGSDDESDVTGSSNWYSTNNEIVNVDQGKVAGRNLGDVSIIANYNGEISNQHKVSVVDSWGESGRLEVTPSNVNMEVGEKQQFNAIVYTNAFPEGKNVTSDPDTTWSLDSGSANGTITQTGQFTSTKKGSVIVRATYELVDIGQQRSDVAVVEVLPPPNKPVKLVIDGASSLVVGHEEQYRAVVYFENGSTDDVTNDVVWLSSSNQILAIGSNGIANPKAAGTAEITATYQTLSDSMKVDVSALNAQVTYNQVWRQYEGSGSWCRNRLSMVNIAPIESRGGSCLEQGTGNPHADIPLQIYGAQEGDINMYITG